MIKHESSVDIEGSLSQISHISLEIKVTYYIHTYSEKVNKDTLLTMGAADFR